MDTRFREEIEFRHADIDVRLADMLPDILSLLQFLTDAPTAEQSADPTII